MKHKFYITTAIPYVNADPHIGHALEFVQADTIARFARIAHGYQTTLLSGSDENALKNVQAAEKAGVDIQTFVDTHARRFQEMAEDLNVHIDLFQKGSDQVTHFLSSQTLWKKCQEHGDIYRKTYRGKYCVGCEVYYTDDELSDTGECLEHPGKPLEIVSEENYFFRLSAYKTQLLHLITSDEIRIIPEKRKHEVLSFLEGPIEDISISRSNTRAKNWGVPVPDDPSQRMYVWFDALNIYQSGIGYGWDDALYAQIWPADLHVIGKGILRFHAVYWPAFLLSARLPTPKAIFVHEYFTVNGQKMSKSIGNVIDPFSLREVYSTDALRYYLLASVSPFSDGDVSLEKLKEKYNADLANGIGNLVARVTSMAKGLSLPTIVPTTLSTKLIEVFSPRYEFDKALWGIWEDIRACDLLINRHEVWKMKGEEKEHILTDLLNRILQIGYDLSPFLPETAALILEICSAQPVQPRDPLFRRMS